MSAELTPEIVEFTAWRRRARTPPSCSGPPPRRTAAAGAPTAEEFGKRNGVPGELLVRVRPTTVLAHLDVSG